MGYRSQFAFDEAVVAYKEWQEANDKRLAMLDEANRNGWRQAELAYAIGVAPSTICRALKVARREPSPFL